MWQLEQQWKTNREKLAQLEQHKADGMMISDARLEAARRQVERDDIHAASIEQAKADKQAKADAETKRIQERNEAHAKAHEEQLLVRARLTFNGTSEQWEAIKSDLLRDLLRREALGEPLPGAPVAGRIRL
jgi:hypothetical protein